MENSIGDFPSSANKPSRKKKNTFYVNPNKEMSFRIKKSQSTRTMNPESVPL
jgi:hypothetical protein